MASLQNFDELSTVVELGLIKNSITNPMQWLGMRCPAGNDPMVSSCNQSSLFWNDGTSTDYFLSRNKISPMPIVLVPRDSCLMTIGINPSFYYYFMPCSSMNGASICKARASSSRNQLTDIVLKGIIFNIKHAYYR